MKPQDAPAHVAIIMDGNGRWAQKRGYPRFYGHIRGALRVREITEAAKKAGVKALTLYAFSTENWKRPQEEIALLWRILEKFCKKQRADLDKNQVSLRVFGDRSALPAGVRSELDRTEALLSRHREFVLNLALSYGGQDEIVRAVNTWIKKNPAQPLTAKDIEMHLDTAHLGASAHVDWMIRTSGEKRLSNFLIWQNAYAEFDFVDKPWPEFREEDFYNSLERYQKRHRRYGRTGDQTP